VNVQSHVMIRSNDIERSKRFYGAVGSMTDHPQLDFFVSDA
jgi:catechol 2,3-dioxygenase-like lactoylglutathione lyase family enzyme